MAASINLDAIGIVKKTDDMKVSILSKGYTLTTISLENLDMQEEDYMRMYKSKTTCKCWD